MIYLASASPRRAEILEKYHIPFQVVPNLLEPEPPIKSGSLSAIKTQVRALAYQKAFASRQAYQGGIVGADTVVVLEDQVLGKPATLQEAKRMLAQLSEKTHSVISVACVFDTYTQQKHCVTDTAEVSFHALTQDQIDAYCRDYPVLDKAGAYAIQDVGDHFIQGYSGAYETIMGLPIQKLLKWIKKYSRGME